MANSTDTSEFIVNPVIPPSLAVICSCIAGLTSFGDAILFQVLWAIVNAVGWVNVDRRTALTKAVLYLSFIPVANLLPFMYVSRKNLLSSLPYALVMAATGLGMVNVGANLLLYGDLTALKISVGAFFIIFSVLRLSISMYHLGVTRRNKPSAQDSDLKKAQKSALQDETTITDALSPRPPREILAPGECTPQMPRHDSVPLVPDHQPEIQLKRRQTHSTEEIVRTPATGDPEPSESSAAVAVVMPDGSSSPAAAKPAVYVPPPLSLCGGKLVVKPISPSYSIPCTFATLLVTGVATGLLGGMFGTGGPPQMIAWSTLKVDKDVLRAVSILYGTLELIVRMTTLATSSQNVFEEHEWPIYVGIIVASWIGWLLGTWWRSKVNSDFIIRALLLLVFASSAILLGALDNTNLAAGFAAGSVAWLLVLALLYYVDWGMCCGRKTRPTTAVVHPIKQPA